ncbi:MAG: hypothetical protein JST10_10700 [Bacteroidetes bacterium]|nr:hypothetical protein [Bacteroidota bacterium]MBS1633027.1 hypothetical protein [Bacteroidota bacterium]
MEKYFNQLLDDIAYATNNISWPFAEKELQLWDWIPDEEENQTAPIRNLQDWTGIQQSMLPPETMLNDEQIHLLLEALNKMLNEYNCCFVLQTAVSERIQYSCIRENFNQDVKVKRWHMGFFETCKPGTEHGKCALGEHCQCAFYAELFKDMIDEDLTPEEERRRELEIEVQHIKRKYGDDWMKYYPYHLDAAYDDEYGNPYDYGFGDEDDDDEDDWWRK